MCVRVARLGRYCGDDNIALTTLQDGDTLELECPVPITATALNGCSGDNLILLGAPSRSDSPVVRPGESFQFVTFSNDPTVLFTPVSGRRTCAISGFTEDNVACGTSAFTFGRIVDQDFIQLVCP